MKNVAPKVILAIAATAIACGMGIEVKAAGTEKTLTGIVTDVACGKSHKLMKGNGTDAQCVRTCVKGGSAFGLVVGDKVITLHGHSAELNKYAAEKVIVTGTMNGSELLVASVKPAK